MFKRVQVGDVAMKLVEVSPGLWMVETWDDNAPISQRERSGRRGTWHVEADALHRAIEHVYEHSAIASEAHAVAARWLCSTN